MGMMTTHKIEQWTSKETQSAGPREVDGLLASLLLVTNYYISLSLSLSSSTPTVLLHFSSPFNIFLISIFFPSL